MSLAIFLAIAAVLVVGVTRSDQHVCGADVVDQVSYKWCIDSQDSAGNTDVLFNLHGGGGSEQSWKEDDDNKELRREWQKMGVPMPTVISISFGPRWLLTDVPQDGHPALYALFMNKIRPVLEAKMGGVQGRRILKGDSMGGFNGAEILLRDASLFERMALLCPGLPTVGPYATPAELETYMSRPYINREWVQDMLTWTKKEFPTQSDWLRNDPLLNTKTLSQNSPSLYVSCGERDEYGFFDGAKKLADLATAQGEKTQWQPIVGGHCVEDAKALAHFLAPLPKADADLLEREQASE